MSETKVELKGFAELLAVLSAPQQAGVIKNGLWKSGLFLKEWIVRNRLSGKRPIYLDRVTGRLASSITVRRPQNLGRGFFTTIGTNVEYAPVHEYGFEGLVTVSAHRRRTGTYSLKTGKRVKRFNRKTTVRKYGMVGQHKRNMRIPARPFLKPAMERSENQVDVAKIFGLEIIRAMQKANKGK